MDKTVTATAHTAGPWNYTHSPYSDNMSGYTIRTGKNEFIAHIESSGNNFIEDKKEREANAQFIVTACNSHDELLDIANQFLQSIADSWGHEKINALVDKAQTVIAKASL